MHASRSATFAVGAAVLWMAAWAWPSAGQENAPPPRELIGQALGQPVYRDQISAAKEISLRDELHRLFTLPLLQKYRLEHKADIEPTKEEIDAATAYFDREHRERIKDEEPQLRARLKAVEDQLADDGLAAEERRSLEIERQTLQSRLDPPGRFFAVFVLGNWKFQRHLYEKYGGGRILWQQAGLEAFDAMRNWLEAHEKQGAFQIDDPALRKTFYEYWTTMNHGPFLTSDKERIRAEFLEPPWAPRPK